MKCHNCGILQPEPINQCEFCFEIIDYQTEFGSFCLKHKNEFQKLESDKEFWLEITNDFEEQLNLVKKHLAQWIEKVSQRVK